MPKLPSILGRVSEEELKKLITDLKKWVKQKHGRQKELAGAMHVTEDTISHWLAGRKRPSLKKFFALRDFLKRAK
jgi:transcriptional regulator with XRE-family HTH domain